MLQPVYYLVLALSLITPSVLEPFVFAIPDDGNRGIEEEVETEEEKAEREAEERAQEVANYAEAAGVDIETSPINTLENPTAGAEAVSVNGIQMDVATAKAAIDAISDSYNHISKTNIDITTTLSAYADGSVCTGCVGGQ